MSVKRVAELVKGMTRGERGELWKELERAGICVQETGESPWDGFWRSEKQYVSDALITARLLGSSERTRRIASTTAQHAYLYATLVDKTFHIVTWRAVRGTDYERVYRESFDVPEGEGDVI